MCNPGHIKDLDQKTITFSPLKPFIFFDLIGPMGSTGRGVTSPLFISRYKTILYLHHR